MQDNNSFSWDEVETILLDMDGTLLDLHFDNYFWQEYLPLKWGELHSLDAATAKSQLLPGIDEKAGTLAWYCLDYWSERLDLDVLELKSEIEHLIEIRPSAEEFLQFVSALEQPVIMVTNSHEGLIRMKMNKTGIDKYFDKIISSHSLGAAKEEVKFWEKLNEEIDYSPESTLLIDDNLQVLRSARSHGIRHLLAIAQPDSQEPAREIKEFPVVNTFESLYKAALA